MGKTSAAAKNRYAAKAYDRIGIIVPKGRKGAVEVFAAAQGESVNGLINRLVREKMGLSEAEWKSAHIGDTEGDHA